MSIRLSESFWAFLENIDSVHPIALSSLMYFVFDSNMSINFFSNKLLLIRDVNIHSISIY